MFVVDKQGVVRFKQSYSSVGDLNLADVLAEVDKL